VICGVLKKCLRPVSELAEEVVARMQSRAAELRCAAELAALPELLRRGGGAGAQRATYEVTGIDAVVRQLTEITASAHQRRG